nr:unnamed protein product [Digitaria exilis]
MPGRTKDGPGNVGAFTVGRHSAAEGSSAFYEATSNCAESIGLERGTWRALGSGAIASTRVSVLRTRPSMAIILRATQAQPWNRMCCLCGVVDALLYPTLFAATTLHLHARLACMLTESPRNLTS